MNWAVEHEIPEAQKVSHQHVDYEHPSKDSEYHCGNCKNYIKPAGEKPRCRTVKTPIQAGDWCKRYAPKEKSHDS